MPGLETAALLAGPALLGYSAYTGERQHAMAKKGVKQAREAQVEAEARAMRQEREGDQEEARARQKLPDLDVLLGDRTSSKPGSLGVDANRLLLGTRFLGR